MPVSQDLGATNLQEVFKSPGDMPTPEWICNSAFSQTIITSTTLVDASMLSVFGLQSMNAKKVADGERKQQMRNCPSMGC